jgi:hypothetical protein
MVGQVPFNEVFAVSPDDTVNFTQFTTQQRLTGAIYVGALGNVATVQQDGTVATWIAVPAGTFLQVACKRVNATGTTALNLMACYWE